MDCVTTGWSRSSRCVRLGCIFNDDEYAAQTQQILSALEKRAKSVDAVPAAGRIARTGSRGAGMGPHPRRRTFTTTSVRS